MIRKIFITVICLLVLYELFVRAIEVQYQPAMYVALTGNTISSQNFLYSETDYDNIFIGSSLTAGIPAQRFAPKTRNLAFTGLGVLEGLEILTRSAKYPKILFIETNTLSRPANQDFLKFLTPIKYTSAKYIHLLKTKNQPTAILSFFYNDNKFFSAIKSKWLGKEEIQAFQPLEIIKKDTSAIVREQEFAYKKTPLFQEMLNNGVKSGQTPTPQYMLDAHIKVIKDYIAILEKNGVKIIFFELPTECELSNTNDKNAVRKAFRDNFPENKYPQIPPPTDCKNIKTSDGIHLHEESGIVFLSYLKGKIKGL